MSFRRTLLAFVLGILAGAIVLPSISQAETLKFRIKSNYKYKVQVEFYSQERNHVWPGNGQAWGLNDYDVHTYNLECNDGEKICYGAWPTGHSSPYWGVGPDNKRGCKGCCYTCGAGDTELITLK